MKGWTYKVEGGENEAHVMGGRLDLDLTWHGSGLDISRSSKTLGLPPPNSVFPYQEYMEG